MKNEFPWGIVIDYFEYNFDGQVMNVTKYNPWNVNGCTLLVGSPNESVVNYHCEELSESSSSLQYLLLAWMTYKNLGLNQHALIHGVAKAIGIYDGWVMYDAFLDSL